MEYSLKKLGMKNKKIRVLGVMMLLTTALYSQSDSLGLPGDNLDLNAVLSIFSKSSTIEDFEKRLNSADTKVNNLDLNGDNQVDYLRVVDYGKEDFHSIVIQVPVSKSESQDVAVIEVVKKENNTAHIQIVGDETLYGKDYILEPENQAPLNSTSSEKKKKKVENDDVYESGNASTNVMVNVWGWPSVTYIYSPGYSYWVSPWYYGYYPTWYSPWAPYGWYSYRRGFVNYNYGFYGYRRYHHAFPHVHSYYYGKRVSSGYVQKTAPHYGKRNTPSHNGNNRTNQPRNSNQKNKDVRRSETNRDSQNKTRSNSENRKSQTDKQNQNKTRTQKSENQNRTNGNNRSGSQNKSQSKSPQKVNSTPRSSGGNSGRSSGGGRSSGQSGNNHRGGR
jgi:uncharacterized membrane protein YgcG